MMDDAGADGEAALWALGARDAAPRPMSPAFLAEVASLREAVALIALGLDAVTPDARVWPALERELAPRSPSSAHARRAVQDAAIERAALRDRLDPLTSPDLTLTTFRGQDTGTARVLAGAGGRRWLVIAVDLPSVAGHDYQLWFVPESGEPVSAGILRPDLLGVHDAVTTVPETLGRVRPAISLEPSGGSPAPTDVKLVGETI
jgi:hypothetical protein